MTEQVDVQELITPQPAAALAGLLDIELPDEHVVPPLWHWVYLLERRPHRELGPDGHPTSGVPAPPGPGRRRMFAGGRVTTHRSLQIGAEARRTVRVTDSVDKQGRSGPLTFVTVRHEIHQSGELAITEEHDIVYRQEESTLAPAAASAPVPPPPDSPQLDLDVEEPLLFRFSALTYNAHRIHYDHRWAEHEGYDDLVVHGPLQVLMMAELLRRNEVSLVGRTFGFRLVKPMIGPQRMTVSALDDLRRTEVRNAAGTVTAVGEVTSAE